MAGPVLGKNIKAFGAALAQADPAATVAALEADGKIALDLNGESMEISKDMVDVKISAKEGFAVAMENNVFTILTRQGNTGTGRRRTGKRTGIQGAADEKTERLRDDGQDPYLSVCR